jgi:hypothetical protein
VNPLTRPFELEVSLPLEECLKRLEENLRSEYLFRRQNSTLEVTKLTEDAYRVYFVSRTHEFYPSPRTFAGVMEARPHCTAIRGTATPSMSNLYYILGFAIITLIALLGAPVLGIVGLLLIAAIVQSIWESRDGAAKRLLQLLQIEGKKK